MKLIHCDMGHMKFATWFFYSTMYACMHVCKYANMQANKYVRMCVYMYASM